MTDSHKLAALRLSGLCEQDREWILSRLPVTDQEKINDLITEFEQFGIDSAHEDLQKIIADKGNVTKSNGTKSISLGVSEESPRCKVINSADINDVINALTNVPDEIAATVLGERKWKWEQDFLLSKGSAGLERFQSLKGKKSKLGDRAKAVLIECLAAELDPASEEGNSFDEMLLAQKSDKKKGIFSRRGKE